MKKTIYLDYNSTTPTAKDVVNAMTPYYGRVYGNISSTHRMGRESRKAADEAREVITDFLGTESVDLIFTSGGTESDNFAIKGVAFANRGNGNHIITTQIEHQAVLESCKFLEEHGFDVTYLRVDKYGMVNPEDLKNAITDKTILVSIMHANNEVGTIQPISELAEVIKKANGSRSTDHGSRIYFHTDAVQSFGKIQVDVDDLGVDLLSISAHKIYGPKGVGALYIKKGTAIFTQQHGGHHERNLRSGTENVPGIVGFAKAVELARHNFKKNEQVKSLRDRLFDGLRSEVKNIYLNGHPEYKLPNTLNISFDSIEGETLILSFDLKGICASTGSACTSGALEQSHVLEAMGVNAALSKGAVRFSLGIYNTKEEIDYCIREIASIVKHKKRNK